MYSFVIAIRSLLMRYRQYVSLFFVCMFGVCISVTSLYVSKGMIYSLTDKARIYFGGDAAFMGSPGCSSGLMSYNINDFFDLLKKDLPEDSIVSGRLTREIIEFSFYFEGTELHLKTMSGVDFYNETNLLSRLDFVSGDLKNISESNGILISKAVADKMHIACGDSLSYVFKDDSGSVNTADFVVKGIFNDSSVFGIYTCYVDINYMRTIYNSPSGTVNRICFQNINNEQIKSIHEYLKNQINMFEYVEDKQIFYDALEASPVPVYNLIPLIANLTEIKIMQKAMTAVITFVVSMLVLIIVAGVGSTYRVFVLRRLNEIGIYMSIGMKKPYIVLTLLFESFVLLVSGCVAGIMFSGVLCSAIHFFDFSFIPAFDIFLTSGLLCPIFDISGTLIVTLCVIIITLSVVLYSVYKSVRVMPCQALASID